MYDKIPGREDLQVHRRAMRDGDNRLAYMADGEIVLNRTVQEKYPELATAVLIATQNSGYDPKRFIAGSDGGRYHEKTGVQEFSDYDFDWLWELGSTVKQGASDLYDSLTEGASDLYDSLKTTATDTWNDITSSGYEDIGNNNTKAVDLSTTIPRTGPVGSNDYYYAELQGNAADLYDTAMAGGTSPAQYAQNVTANLYDAAMGGTGIQETVAGVTELPWYEQLYNNASNTVKNSWQDFIDDPLDNQLVQSAGMGAGSYALARLSGADAEQARNTAIAGALSYGAAGGKDATTMDQLLAGAMGAYGAYDSYVPETPVPTNMAPTNDSGAGQRVNYTDILNSTPESYLKENDRANVNAIPSQPTPNPGPMRTSVGRQEIPDGVNYLDETVDNEGNRSYTKSDSFGGRFGSGQSANSRRQGFTKKTARNVLYM